MNIIAKIRGGNVTAADFNQLITETSAKSTHERLRRVGEPIDHNRKHDSQGHGDSPNFQSRAVHRRGGGKLNDPRKTARGRGMLRHQRRTKSESLQQTYAEAIQFIQEHHGKPYCLGTLESVQRPDRLAQLTVRLLRESRLDRDWLYFMHRQLQAIQEKARHG